LHEISGSCDAAAALADRVVGTIHPKLAGTELRASWKALPRRHIFGQRP
jgi:hypothetical protein